MSRCSLPERRDAPRPTAATRAIQIEPTLGEAHTSIGKVLCWYEWDFEGASRVPLKAYRVAGAGGTEPVTLAYETYGRLSPRRDNAVLICHALSGDSHVARHDADDDRDGERHRIRIGGIFL